MELRPHDLLEVINKNDIISYSPIPEWLDESLVSAPFVVVRRARAEDGLVAVGIRGKSRQERFAAFLPIKKIVKIITPEQLVEEIKWKTRNKEIFNSLNEVMKLMNQLSLTWGPTGSVGFELATGKSVITEKSDIDIIIRSEKGMKKEVARELLAELRKIPYSIDVQIEFEEGAYSLIEYATALKGEKTLLRTLDGPMLKLLY